MKYIELPVRSTFKTGGSWYIVQKSVDVDSCEGCAMSCHSYYDPTFQYSCSGHARSDQQDVIFVRLEHM